jgi:hypothetical protein
MSISKHLFTIAFAITGLALTAPVASASPCSPDLTVEYRGNHGTSIKVTALEYRLRGTSVWHREGVTNKVLDRNESHTFRSQRLGQVAKGQQLDLRAVFKPDTGNDYGSEQRGSIRTSPKECENNVTYLLVVE